MDQVEEVDGRGGGERGNDCINNFGGGGRKVEHFC